MGEVVALKDIYDDFEVQFEVITPIDFHKQLDERQKRIACGLASIDDQLAETQTVLDRLNSDIDRLTTLCTIWWQLVAAFYLALLMLFA